MAANSRDLKCNILLSPGFPSRYACPEPCSHSSASTLTNSPRTLSHVPQLGWSPRQIHKRPERDLIHRRLVDDNHLGDLAGFSMLATSRPKHDLDNRGIARIEHLEFWLLVEKPIQLDVQQVIDAVYAFGVVEVCQPAATLPAMIPAITVGAPRAELRRDRFLESGVAAVDPKLASRVVCVAWTDLDADCNRR